MLQKQTNFVPYRHTHTLDQQLISQRAHKNTFAPEFEEILRNTDVNLVASYEFCHQKAQRINGISLVNLRPFFYTISQIHNHFFRLGFSVSKYTFKKPQHQTKLIKVSNKIRNSNHIALKTPTKNGAKHQQLHQLTCTTKKPIQPSKFVGVLCPSSP